MKFILCIIMAFLGASSVKADDFDYYLLAMSWAPSFCATHRDNQTPECTQPYKFVLHGLWPQYTDGQWPQNCHFYGDLPSEITNMMIDIMPSESLMNHEYLKHGTCS